MNWKDDVQPVLSGFLKESPKNQLLTLVSYAAIVASAAFVVALEVVEPVHAALKKRGLRSVAD